MRTHTARSIFSAAMLIAGALAIAVPARADIVVYSGIHGGNDGTSNVLYNGVDDILGPATHIRGHVQNARVEFIGSDFLVANSPGQEGVTAASPSFLLKDLEIVFAPQSTDLFTKAIFTLDAALDGNVTISAFGADHELLGDSKDFLLSRNGKNFFTVLTEDTHKIKSIGISSSVALKNVGQIRLGSSDALQVAAAPVAAVPEPASVILVGSVIAAVAIMLKCRRKKFVA